MHAYYQAEMSPLTFTALQWAASGGSLAGLPELAGVRGGSPCVEPGRCRSQVQTGHLLALQAQLQARARTLAQGVGSLTNERVALEQSVAELNGKAIALERWLADNEAKTPQGGPATHRVQGLGSGPCWLLPHPAQAWQCPLQDMLLMQCGEHV